MSGLLFVSEEPHSLAADFDTNLTAFRLFAAFLLLLVLFSSSFCCTLWCFLSFHELHTNKNSFLKIPQTVKMKVSDFHQMKKKWVHLTSYIFEMELSSN